jgi:hypothetical protein
MYSFLSGVFLLDLSLSDRAFDEVASKTLCYLKTGRQKCHVIVRLVLADGPRFVARPVDQAADIGAEQAILSCDVDSSPQASIEWTRSGSPASILGRSAQLTISPVTLESFGTYTCTANVTGFASISADVRLLMNG